MRPDTRPSPDHAGHDRWLVVRWTTDPTDLTPEETAQARALLAACAECADLSADLEVISRATAASVVPARPRDFRLTPEQAASSRGGALDRLRRWLASPGSFAVRPLAGAALAIGLVLVVVAPNLRMDATTAGDGTGGVNGHAVAPATSAAEATLLGPQADAHAKETPGTERVQGVGPEMDAMPAPTGGPGTQANLTMGAAASPSPTQAADTTMAGGRDSASPDGVTGEVAPPDGTGPDEGTTGDRGAGQAERPTTSQAADAASDATTFALTLLGIVLAGTGLMVLVFAWLARRWQDPLLR